MIVGLTGQTGAGKSTVSDYLRENGVVVIDADKIAREVVETGSACIADIALEFGCEYINMDGTLNRKKMARTVFNDKEKLKKLNNLMFPYIIDSIRRELKRLREQQEGIIVLDAPTLFESGADRECDRVVSVTADVQSRKERIIRRDKLTEEEADERIQAQHDEEYYKSRSWQVLENNGVACCCLPVDADGLSVEALSGSGAAVCYVTPSHQFPTGVTMPAGRRTELLHWASRCPGQRYIIEDDYDSEFRFDTRPLPSLQGMAGADGPVVYLSTCSRSLAPGIRIAYMVLPRQLLPAWRAKYRIYSGTVSRFEQQTLARFIREGYFTRHLARERVAYKARRDALAASLRAAFAPDELTLTGLHAGLHLLASLKNAPPDAALHAAAKAQGVALSLLSDYDLTGGEQDFSGTFVLGYGSLSEASFPEAGETLRKVCTAAREASDTV